MMRRRVVGFSLLEMIVVIAIVGLLAVVAVPAYNSYILKSNRTDAIQSLLAIQLAEEKYRVSNNSYGTLAQVWGGVATSSGGHYTLGISNVSATSYTITATASGSQTSDSEDGASCSTMTLTYANNVTTKAPAACWIGN